MKQRPQNWPKRVGTFLNNYRAVIFLAAAILLSSSAFSQVDTTKLLQYINAYGYRYKNGAFDSSFRVPADTFKLSYKDTSAMAIKNKVLYTWSGSNWKAVALKVNDTTFIINGDTVRVSTTGGGGGSGTTDLTFSRNSTTVTVISSTGTDAVLPAATTTNAGVMTGAMKQSLDSTVTNITRLNDSVTVYYNSQGVEVYRTTDSVFSFINSLEAPTSRTAQLVNDAASPGNNKVYGTDGSGVKGWKADPAGGGLSGLTTNRIPFAASSTSISDDATFTFNTTTKEVTAKKLIITNNDGEATPNGAVVFNGTFTGGTEAGHAIVNQRIYSRSTGAIAFIDDGGSSTVTTDHTISLQSRPTHTGGTLTTFHGTGIYPTVSGTGVATNIWNHTARSAVNNGTTTENVAYNVEAPTLAGSGAITNSYGLKVANLTNATNNYSIFTGTAQSYFGGTVRIPSGELILNDLAGTNNVPFTLGNTTNNTYPSLNYNAGLRVNSGKFLVSDIALKLDLNATGFVFRGSNTGTAGNTITFTDLLTVPIGNAATLGNLILHNGQMQVNTNTPAYFGAKSSADYPEFTYNYDLRNNIYKITDEAYRFRLDNGFSFQTAASGTLGTAPTWTQRALLTDAGKFKIGIGSPTVTLEVGSTDAALLPVGTTAQRPTGAAGYIRYNSDSSKYEFHNGSAWASFGAGGAGGSSYTSSNGITLTGSDFTWGGSLTGNTTIAQGANTITYTGSGVHTIAAQVNFNNVGANARFKGDGTGANDAGMFVSGGGQIAFGNWDFSRGFSIETDGRINLLGTTALKLQGGTSAARPSTLAAGQLRYLSTSSNRPEYYNGTTWELLAYSSDIVTNPIYPWNQAGIDSANTTNATSTTVKTITIPDASRGIIEVRMDCIGTDDGTKGLTGIKRVRYKKTGGTLTLGTVEDEMAIERDGGLTTATFTITTSSNNIIIQVTGEAATNLKWKPTYLMTNNAIAL